MARTKAKATNEHCSVKGCEADRPHQDDPTVQGLMKVFGTNSSICHWSLAAMVDLRASILDDIQAKRFFAWQTRLRQVEEIYFKALYCVLIAEPNELPHIFSGKRPNSVTLMYREVNKIVLEGRGRWEVEKPGQTKPIELLHNGAHASYSAMFTAICAASNEAELRLDAFQKHLDTYCTRLEHMRDMFNAGRDRTTVLEAMRNMHRPISYWQDKAEEERKKVASKSVTNDN